MFFTTLKWRNFSKGDKESTYVLTIFQDLTLNFMVFFQLMEAEYGSNIAFEHHAHSLAKLLKVSGNLCDLY